MSDRPSERMQWVFTNPCGCPVGVLEGSEASSELEAWNAFYDGEIEESGRALDWGVRVEFMPHDRYEADVLPSMLADCPHRVVVTGA